MEPRASSPPTLASRAVPPVVILLATWLLLWLAQGVPLVCALALPCPAPDVRVAPALLFGGLMLVPVAVLLVTAWSDRAWRGVRGLSYAVLVALAVVGLAAVLFSGGFGIGFGI